MGLVYGKYGKAGEQHSPCFPFFLVDENAYTVVGTRYHATVRGVAIEIGASASSSRFLFRRGKSGEPAADFCKRFLPKFSSALRAGHYTAL